MIILKSVDQAYKTIYENALEQYTQRPLMVFVHRWNGSGTKPLRFMLHRGSKIWRIPVKIMKSLGRKQASDATDSDDIAENDKDDIEVSMSHMFLPAKYNGSLYFPGNYLDYVYAGNPYHVMPKYSTYKKIFGAILLICWTFLVYSARPDSGTDWWKFYEDPWLMAAIVGAFTSSIYLYLMNKSTDMDQLHLTVQEMRRGEDKQTTFYCHPSDLPQSEIIQMFGVDVPPGWYEKQTNIMKSLKKLSGDVLKQMDSQLREYMVRNAKLTNLLAKVGWRPRERSSEAVAVEFWKTISMTIFAAMVLIIAVIIAIMRVRGLI